MHLELSGFANKVALVGLLLAAISPAGVVFADENERIAIGVARVDITPREPVVLAGYGGRTTEHEGIDTRLWARALVIGADNPVAIIAIDNCGVPASVTEQLAERLAPHGIPSDRFIVAATHTHNAPNLVGYAPVVWAGRLTPEQEAHMRDYTAFAILQMETAVVSALKNREPMKLAWTRGRASFGGNRRVLTDGQWSGFGFQRSGPVDHNLPVMTARDDRGRIRMIWSNYACHCTTVGSRNRVGGDWAGFANEAIEREYSDAVSLITIGCGADIGPQPSGSLELARQHGDSIADSIKQLLSDETTPLLAEPIVVSRTIQLPLEPPRDRAYWEEQFRSDGFNRQLAKAMLERMDGDGEIKQTVDYPMTTWQFGDQLAIVFLAGEVVVDYSVRLNQALDWSRLWITAWADDVPGYIPSRRILQEGGYEADFSQVYYEQPGRYAPEIEELLVSSAVAMLDSVFVAAEDQPEAPFHRLPSQGPAALQRLADWAQRSSEANEPALLKELRRIVPLAQAGVDTNTLAGGESTDWYDFAGEFTARRCLRLQSHGVTVSWQSPPLEPTGDEPLVLSFTGGMGWQSQPKTDGYELKVEGFEALPFDLSREATNWSNDEGSLQLYYLPSWHSTEDSGGFFFLVVSTSGVEVPNRLKFEVRSLGAGSQRWFAVDTNQRMSQLLPQVQNALK